MLQSVIEYHRVLQSIAKYYRVLQNIIEYYRVYLAHLLRPISGLVFCDIKHLWSYCHKTDHRKFLGIWTFGHELLYAVKFHHQCNHIRVTQGHRLKKKYPTEKACFMKTSGILQLLSRSSTYIDNLGENLGDLFISKLETLYFNNS